MSDKPVIIIGAGGHATVVADALMAAGHTVLGFTDADARRLGHALCGLAILGTDQVLQSYNPAHVALANGIGSLSNDSEPLRYRVQRQLEQQGWKFCSVIHPSAWISPHATLEHAVQIMAGSVVQVAAHIETGVIINTRAVVEHDTRVGAWSHVAPGAVICGDVTIGPQSHIGAGAVIKQGLKLGEQTLVGLGSAVVADFPGQGVLTGIPARSKESNI